MIIQLTIPANNNIFQKTIDVEDHFNRRYHKPRV